MLLYGWDWELDMYLRHHMDAGWEGVMSLFEAELRLSITFVAFILVDKIVMTFHVP